MTSAHPPKDAHSRHKVARGLAWHGSASTIVSLLDILSVVIILRRWISQETYGVASWAVTLFPFLDLVTDLGVTSAVIQRDDHSPEKISTVFWLNVLLSIAALGLCMGLGGFLAAIHHHQVLFWMFLAWGVKLLWQNVYIIPVAMMRKELRFKELSIIRVLANLAEALGKIGFAWAGFGVWSFVLGPMCRVVVTGVGSQLRHPWRPHFVWRFNEAREYAVFGLKASASQILFHLYTNLDYQVVGVFFGPVATGIYAKAYAIVLEPVRIISNVVGDVAFPTFARLRTNRPRLLEQFLSFVRMNLVTVLPFVAIVLIASPELSRLVWGANDAIAVAPAARILCAVAGLRALSFVMPPLLDGIGKPSLTLVYTVVAAVCVTAMFVLFAWLLGPRLNFLSVAWAWAVGYPIAFVVLLTITLRQLGLRGIELVRRTAGIPLCAAAAMLPAWGAYALLEGATPNLRLVVTTVVLLGALGVLLAYLQGISPRTIGQALAAPEEPAAPPASSEGPW